MPGKTSMTIWYVVLALAVFASAGFMGLEIRERLRSDLASDEPLAETGADPSDDSSQATPILMNDQEERRRIAMIFRRTSVFQPLVTPKPSPTPKPLPPATPTPRPLAQNYTIENILGSSAILVDYRLIRVVVKKGKVVEDQLGHFVVEEVDPKGMRVRVKLLSDGYERWITERAARQKAPRK